MNLKDYDTIQSILTLKLKSPGKAFPAAAARWWLAIPILPSFVSEFLFRLVVLGLVLLTIASSAHACGPFFPNNLLGAGDAALLAAPVANFRRELARLEIAPSRFEHFESTNSYTQETFDAELADLAIALKKAKVPNVEAALIIEGHRRNRAKLSEFVAANENWESKAWMDADPDQQAARGAAPVFPMFAEVLELPVEFADYFAGAAALRNPDAGAGAERDAWERLLARPAADRKYKSTWAAFMLGKSWEEEDADKAVEYFRQTRELAQRGFADSIGLAAAAIGLEARVELRRDHFPRAIELYLEQYATGDASAVQSLQIAAQRALNQAPPEQLVALATNKTTRNVILAQLISDHVIADYPTGERPTVTPVAAWLTAVEAADVKDVDSAERLALAAYQEGEFDVAQRWIKRAKSSPVAQWLQAKLFLRAGKTVPAAALLSRVAELLPVVAPVTITNSTEFADGLNVAGNDYWSDGESARRQILGELGTLKLSRGDFEQALDALLRAGFWEDAAYVAERVLTPDELKSYVDREWPTGKIEEKLASAGGETPAPAETPSDVFYDLPQRPEIKADQIRHLLARRLVRELRAKEARPYFPAAMQTHLDELILALDAGWNESAPAIERARSLFAAAKIARADGMELLGTELAPDYFIHGGNFEYGLNWQERATNSQSATVNIANETELSRAAQHKADPEARFHYRYQAAFLAWEAAKLLPNDSDETARVLCTAGAWLKNRDPETADLFYKALVKRCRKTAIGEQADRMRWFPVLDEAGNPKAYTPKVPAPAANEEVDDPNSPITPAAEAIEPEEAVPSEVEGIEIPPPRQ